MDTDVGINLFQCKGYIHGGCVDGGGSGGGGGGRGGGGRGGCGGLPMVV